MSPGPSRRGDRSLVVVGASLAGLRAVEAARSEGFSGEIVLIGAEPHLPYDRPPLSKAFLEGRTDGTSFRDRTTLTDDLGVRLLLGSPATGLDLAGKQVATTAGAVCYDRLIIATGAAARTVPAGHGVPGVHVLRTVDDATAIRSAIRSGARVVVVGAGFIGSEVAAACHRLGADVTIVEGALHPLARAVGPRMGAALSSLHALHGVPMRTGVTVEEVIGRERVSAVALSDGSVLETDLLVVGIGATPATSWLQGSGVALHPADGGVLCDAHLATTAADVWAAGDVAHWHNTAFDRAMRLENWTSAAQQGAQATRNAIGRRPGPYSTVPYYWSDWYGHRIQFVGVPDADEVQIQEGSVESGRMVALYRSGSRVVGALTLNEPRLIMKLRALIDAGAPWEDALAFVKQRPARPPHPTSRSSS